MVALCSSVIAGASTVYKSVVMCVCGDTVGMCMCCFMIIWWQCIDAVSLLWHVSFIL